MSPNFRLPFFHVHAGRKMASRWRLRNPENRNAGNREINPENSWNCMGRGK
jgi:hypothetical protein